MIYTLTLNPAVDYIVQVPDYTLGAINRTAEEQLLSGGKGINVSWVLKNLGIPNIALGFTAGFTGELLANMLERQGIQSDFIPLPQGQTRINVKIKTEQETDINGQGPLIDPDDLEKLSKKLSMLKDGDTLVLAGSVPLGIPDTIYGDILSSLQERDILTVVDATGSLLTNALPYHPFLIKPNLNELEEIFGENLPTRDDICRCAKELQQRGARNVLVSLGGDGALLVCEDGQVLFQSAPEGKVINTTGAGDSMVAGFLAGFAEHKNFTYALLMGIAAGSASAFSENLATKNEIRILERGILHKK